MKAVCLGLTTLDVVQQLAEAPVLGRKQVVASTELVAGGPAANAAITAAALLGECTLVTVLGDSPSARLVRAELESRRVHVVDLFVAGRPAAEGWQLPVSSCVIDPDGDRTVFSTSALTSRFLLTAEAEQVLAEADGLLLDGHHPVAAGMAVGLVGDSQTVTVLDAGSLKPAAESWMSWLDVVAGSADYARALGCDLDGAIAHVLEQGATAAVMTDGPGEVLWCAPTSAGRVRPEAVTAVDTLGAGDAFHGALLAGLVHTGDLGRAVELAVRVAGLRVQHAGARGWLSGLGRLFV